MKKQKEEGKSKIQCLLFSATIPDWVRNIARPFMSPDLLTIDLCKNIKNKTAAGVQHLAINCPYQNRANTLADVVLCYGGKHKKTLVFSHTKAEANELFLNEKFKGVEVLHGDIPQNQREITFKGFKEGRFPILVATDVASRGLDIPHVDLIVQTEPPKDVETYIHRSGRTARAGREGIVITFYTMKQLPLISKIEYRAGIKLQKIGAPLPNDIIKASSRDSAESLCKVNETIIPLYMEAAQNCIKTYGPEKAVAMALAYMSGNYTEMKNRSLLTGSEDFITYKIETTQEFNTVSYIWGILKKIVSPEIVETVKTMRCFASNKGAAFDIPEKYSQLLEESYKREMSRYSHINYQLEKVTALPDLKEFGDMQYSGGRTYNGVSSFGQSTQKYGYRRYDNTRSTYNANPYNPQSQPPVSRFVAPKPDQHHDHHHHHHSSDKNASSEHHTHHTTYYKK